MGGLPTFTNPLAIGQVAADSGHPHHRDRTLAILHDECCSARLVQNWRSIMSPPPIRKFALGDPVHVRAQQVWLILVAHVMSTAGQWRTRLLTYGDLAVRMGHDRRAGIGLGRELGIVGKYCIDNGLPGLNCIVIGQDTGTPGPGVLHSGKNWIDDVRKVVKLDWFKYRVPTTGTLRQVRESMS
jgi:hypothetical protein